MNLDVIPDPHLIGDEDILTQATIFSDLCLRHNVAKVPDFGVFADLCPIVYERGRVDIGGLWHGFFI